MRFVVTQRSELVRRDRKVQDRSDPVEHLATKLGQPLAAAANYIGVARMILLSDSMKWSADAVENLDRAGEQILRAGTMVGELRKHAGSDVDEIK
jgi:phosphoglycerate-specific signal transduction histidine kinase